MTAFRVFLYALAGALVFGILAYWGYRQVYNRLESTGELSLFLGGLVGALVGAVAGAAQSIVEAMQASRPAPPSNP
jgi:uncharacterized membrane protein YeaQ/YmgE (transglycosylase-associated protein family)